MLNRVMCRGILRYERKLYCPLANSLIVLHVSRILVIGGFLSSSERLNDVWVYSVVSRQWEDKTPPSGQRATVFLPRGGHSACCIGSRLWVYGGYGGALYSRKDLDDVCVLNLETWNWVKVRIKG